VADKPIQYWRVDSVSGRKPEWRQIDDIVPTPEAFNSAKQQAYGDLIVENDTHIMMVITGDKKVHDIVSKAFSEAAALSNEAESQRRQQQVRCPPEDNDR
jgi:hypothetical protein